MDTSKNAAQEDLTQFRHALVLQYKCNNNSSIGLRLSELSWVP